MLAVEQPSSIWNYCCFDWTCSAHISLRSGMPKHPKIVPITVGRLNLHEPHKEMMFPIRNENFEQISFSEPGFHGLGPIGQHQKTQVTAQAETSRPKRRKIIYLPTRSSDDSCSA